MLSEIKNARQIEGEGFRRWFRDDELDLIVWYSSENAKQIVGFQLCYDKMTSERAFTWHPPNRYEHHAIDHGRSNVHNIMTPILVADGVFDSQRIHDIFMKRGKNLPKEIVELVEKKISTFPG